MGHRVQPLVPGDMCDNGKLPGKQLTQFVLYMVRSWRLSQVLGNLEVEISGGLSWNYRIDRITGNAN